MLRLIVLSATLAAASACWCFTTSNVNVRAEPCGSVIGSGNTGQCYEARDGMVDCDISGTTYTFVEFQYGDVIGWAADDYMALEDSSRCALGETCGDARLVTRAEWGARPPTSTTPLTLPLTKHFVHHSAGGHCYTEADCMATVRGIQNYHMDSNGWSDIGYNFLVGEDGNIYEGRGWNNQGAHATDWNSQSHGTCVMGTFTSGMPNQDAQKALQSIIDCGVDEGNTVSAYTLHGHRDGGCTECPGTTFYNNWVVTHDHYGGWLSGCLKKEWGPSILYD